MHNKTKYVVGLIILTVISLVFAYFYHPSPIILEVKPTNGTNLANLRTPITIIFNKPVDINKIKILLVPEEKFDTTQPTNNSIILNFPNFLPLNRQYSINIIYDKKSLGTFSYSTSNNNVQFDANLIQEVENDRKINYPLLFKLPYTTSNYSAGYSAPLTLEITPLNPNLTSSEIIDEVKSWVKQNGGDVTAHKFVVATP